MMSWLGKAIYWLLGSPVEVIHGVTAYMEGLFEGKHYPPQTLTGQVEKPDLRRVEKRSSLPDSLRIVHLSDLHFGAAHQDKIDHLTRLVSNSKPDLLVVSGDIVNRPTPENFDLARGFLKVLAGSAGHVIVCAGNHDRHGEPDLQAFMTGLQLPRGPHYCQFLEYSNGLKVAAFVFNSTPCQAVNPRSGLKSSGDAVKRRIEEMVQVRGWVDPTQLEMARGWHADLQSTRQDDYRKALKIAVLHHHPLPTRHSEYSEQFLVLLNSGQVLDCLTELGIDIVFHGHQHEPLIQSLRRGAANREMLVLSAGTATKSSAGGKQEKTLEMSEDSGFFEVWVSNKRIQVDQYTYTNAYNLPFKFIPTRRMSYERRPGPLRLSIATRWTIEWPSGDFSVSDRHTLTASGEDLLRYDYSFGCDVPVPFEDLGFTVKRERNGEAMPPPEFVVQAYPGRDAVGDAMSYFGITCTCDPPVSAQSGTDDVLEFAYKWPRGFADLFQNGTVQSDLSYKHPLDEWRFDIRLEGGGVKIGKFIVLPNGPTEKDGLIDPRCGPHVSYVKKNAPAGVVFNYEMTYTR